MRVSRKKITIPGAALRDAKVVDVLVDGRRVWSTVASDAVDGRDVQLSWPRSLTPYLRGSARIEVRDSGTGRVLDSTFARLGWRRSRIEVRDARGRWLAMTKWNRLGPVLEGRQSTGDRLVRAAAALVDHLEQRGDLVYLVGGSLLGVKRGGELLPHDDDIDLAFLCEANSVIDVGLASYVMERSLASAGFTVIRHSLAHLEIEFFDDDGSPECYVDIFTGFFRDDDYCQPFALKGSSLVREDLVPTRRVTLGGVDLPEPARAEKWLSFAYGEGWRVPDPSFRFAPEKSVTDRFESWFGVFNRGRVFWDKRYLAGSDSGIPTAKSAIKRFCSRLPEGALVVDLGCGDGRWTRQLAATGLDVTGIDYSHEALRIARAGGATSAKFRHLNLNDRAAVLEFGAELLRDGRECYFFLHHSLQTLTKVNRQNVFLLLDLVLRGRGFAYAVSDEHLAFDYRRGDPGSWHLPVEWLEREIEGHPLAARRTTRGLRRYRGRLRQTRHVVLTRTPGHVLRGDARRLDGPMTGVKINEETG